MPSGSTRFALLVLATGLSATVVHGQRRVSSFMGRAVTITEPELDVDGFFPKGPATICLEAPPRRQCYTAPEDYGRFAEVELVQIDKRTSRLLFSAASGGGRGVNVDLCLLQPRLG